ncbi:MAG TPA: preprotein translocase subunit YajC [Thermodesulfobacteriota bacterium]|nr:preprotein translocase subunit YajC [Thermodesulfobacteriota bacterium]
MGTGLAYAMGPTPGGGGGASSIMSFLPIILIFIVFYFLLIRPQQKRAKEHRALLSNLREGDKVLTSGGIIGRITGIKDDEITVEISDKVRVKFARGSITQVLRSNT